MGSAIPLTHYTGMWAVVFHASSIEVDQSYSGGTSSLAIAVICTVTLALLSGAIVMSLVDRIMAAQRLAMEAAREGELYFRTLAETVPEMIWTAAPDGVVDFVSSQWITYTGLSPELSVGHAWELILHPDDRDASTAAWQRAVRTGQTYEMEYRFRRGSDGAYRWFLGRANPLRDANGQILKWFGTSTDIEDQKHHQQILEWQIKERTEELADANTRLQQEMLEREHARRELDEQNEKMLQDLIARSQRATLLAKMGELLQSCLSKEEVFAAAMGFAPKIFPTSRGAVALFNATRNLV